MGHLAHSCVLKMSQISWLILSDAAMFQAMKMHACFSKLKCGQRDISSLYLTGTVCILEDEAEENDKLYPSFSRNQVTIS